MKRFILDILVILVIVSIVSVLSVDTEQSVGLDDKLANFEQQIENGVVYDSDKEIYLLQIEENSAGKLGNSLSVFIVSVVEEGMRLVKTIVEVF